MQFLIKFSKSLKDIWPTDIWEQTFGQQTFGPETLRQQTFDQWTFGQWASARWTFWSTRLWLRHMVYSQLVIKSFYDVLTICLTAERFATKWHGTKNHCGQYCY